MKTTSNTSHLKYIVLATILLASLFTQRCTAEVNTLFNVSPDLQTFQDNLTELNQSVEQTFYSTREIVNIFTKRHQFESEIDECINKEQSAIESINQVMKNTAIQTVFTPNTSAYQNLEQQRLLHLNRSAYCIYYKNEFQQIEAKLDQKINHQSVSMLGYKTKSLAQQIQELKQSPQSFNTALFFQELGYHDFSSVQLLTIVSLLSLSMALWLGMRKNRQPQKLHILREAIILLPIAILVVYLGYESPSSHLIGSWMSAVLVYLIGTSLFRWALILAAQGQLIPQSKKYTTYFAWIVFSGTLIFVIRVVFNSATKAFPPSFLWINEITYGLAIIRVYLALAQTGQSWLSHHVLQKLDQRLTVTASILLLGFIGKTILMEQPHCRLIEEIGGNVFITVLNLSLLWLVSLCSETDDYKKMTSMKQWPLIKLGFYLFGIGLLTLSLCGIQDFTLLFFPKLLTTIVVLGVIPWDVTKNIHALYSRLTSSKDHRSIKINEWLGVSPHKKILEFMILRVIINIPVYYIALIATIIKWSPSPEIIEYIVRHLAEGYTFAGVNIEPKLWLRACFYFSVILLMGRIFTTYVIQHFLFNEEKHTKVTIALTFRYIFFSIGLIIGLVLAGVNLKGIFVVAGALSVGLGFGLQHFASDFVSGLFIIANKPIRIGDRVLIDGVEGYVVKIGILTTRISSPNQSDIIIPNSSVITKSVINYTFNSNKLCCLNTKYILNDASMLEKSKEIILKVAAENPHVIPDHPMQPLSVLLDLVLTPKSTQTMVLNLWCIIDNVNKIDTITSELNASILKSFVDAQIKI